jgi:hypothetical protein
MTHDSFKRKAESAFLRSNPTATITGWPRAPRLITYPTGLREWGGSFHAIADGSRSKVVIASGDDSYVMVR